MWNEFYNSDFVLLNLVKNKMKSPFKLNSQLYSVGGGPFEMITLCTNLTL